MSKKTFGKIEAGLNDAIQIAKGEANPATFKVHVPAHMDVKAIRGKTHLSQERFAARYGIPVASVRDWEQGRSRPEGASRAYLLVIDRAPETVAKVLEDV